MTPKPRDEEYQLMAPEVKNCAVQECFYNQNELCHANAIMVGSGHPACDTFAKSQSGEHGVPAPTGHVGACHERDCKFNDELSCHAGAINVDRHQNHADCVTFIRVDRAEEDVDSNLIEQTINVEFEGSRASRIDRTVEEEL